MSEERSCEEAFDEWIASEVVAAQHIVSTRDAFRAGAAWARTPTLPAGMTDEFRSWLIFVDSITSLVAYRYPKGLEDETVRDLIAISSRARALAAGDRPPAEREETQ